jgi:hypothetical protein
MLCIRMRFLALLQITAAMSPIWMSIHLYLMYCALIFVNMYVATLIYLIAWRYGDNLTGATYWRLRISFYIFKYTSSYKCQYKWQFEDSTYFKNIIIIYVTSAFYLCWGEATAMATDYPLLTNVHFARGEIKLAKVCGTLFKGNSSVLANSKKQQFECPNFSPWVNCKLGAVIFSFSSI